MEENLKYGSVQYKPVGALGYIAYNILFGIPLVGLIFSLVWSFSRMNINRRNYARSVLIVKLIVIGLIVWFFVSGGYDKIAVLIQNAVSSLGA